MHKLNDEMRACIEACLSSHSACYGMAMNHCLEAGGRHVEPAHFRLMIECAEACATAARFMMIGSERHTQMCRLCADVCEACAASCEATGDMQECVVACRRCAEHCRQMAA
ncbi:MAG: four-helix bundle copper-binding protein [Allosphingosinicella sp.]|uniref:four-helix bundle copper-binding protein n=1 Tax=Allosphingosinicella sp. TaxID=2823234 RepID=UPI003937D94C